MILDIPIAVRRYPGGTCIAETLHRLSLKALGPDEDEAILRLEADLEEKLSRLHPRTLWPLTDPPSYEAYRVELPLYRDLPAVPEEETDATLMRPVDVVVGRRPSMPVQLICLDFNRSVWSEERAAESPRERWPGLDRLARRMRQEGTKPSNHRPPSESVRITDLQLDVEPLDLRRVDADEYWRDRFGEEDIESDETQGPETPTLERIAERWTIDDGEERRRRGFEPAYGRRSLLAEIRRLLGSQQPTPVVLVGPSRVGKTALVQHLAWETAAGDKSGARAATAGPGADLNPHERLDHPLWFADPPRLTSAESAFGGWQQQCADALDELSDNDHILYLGRLVDALDAGKHINSDYNLAQFLKPLLADRSLRCVAEATVEEWNVIERRDIGFARSFEVVRVTEPTGGRGRRILDWSARRLAKHHGIELADGAVDRIWQLQTRFAAEGSPVGTAIDFAERLLRGARQQYQETLQVADVVERFCQETGLPEVLLRDDRSLDLATVRDELSERVMGQPQAIDRVADVIGITKAGLGARDRPFGSFLFVGPTGVGKTELARALAAFLFGDESRMIRLDMSEYASADAYGRLLGEHGGEGELTAPVRRQPFSVVLLDEIEKAHATVYDVLLQVLGEARLTDADGRTTRFQNTIIILTSNLGVDSAGSSIGFEGAEPEDGWDSHFQEAVDDFFRPEFLGRIDQVIPFRPLDRQVVRRIAGRQLEELRARDGIRNRDITLSYQEAVRDWVAERGWDQRYGARPIERVVEQSVAWRLARAFASHEEPLPRATRARLVTDDEELDVELEPPRSDESTRARQRLVGLVDRAAGLRRRLDRYVQSSPFARLKERVEAYDTSSQSADFWDQTEDAAELAQQAEAAREVLEPSDELADSLRAVEDLAREAYHDRSWEMARDLSGQLDGLDHDVDRLMYTLLRLDRREPDVAVLFVGCEEAESELRDRWVAWYRALARHRDWRCQLWQAIPPGERKRGIGRDDAFERSELWRTQGSPHGETLALEFRGPAVRALLMAEDGRHRVLTAEDREDLDVVWLEDGESWPHPDVIDPTHPRQVARVWDLADQTVRLVDEGLRMPLDDDPWKQIFPVVRRHLWEQLRAEG
jgi:ATP-dependent Clp protease ATP-binding subunit ClpA